MIVDYLEQIYFRIITKRGRNSIVDYLEQIYFRIMYYEMRKKFDYELFGSNLF